MYLWLTVGKVLRLVALTVPTVPRLPLLLDSWVGATYQVAWDQSPHCKPRGSLGRGNGGGAWRHAFDAAEKKA